MKEWHNKITNKLYIKNIKIEYNLNTHLLYTLEINNNKRLMVA
jgi:hypothetical protein